MTDNPKCVMSWIKTNLNEPPNQILSWVGNHILGWVQFSNGPVLSFDLSLVEFNQVGEPIKNPTPCC